MTPMMCLLTASLFFTALAYAQPVDLMVRAEPTDNSRFRNTVIIFACSAGGGFLANIALFIAVHMRCSKESTTTSDNSQSNSLQAAQEMAKKAAELSEETVDKADDIAHITRNEGMGVRLSLLQENVNKANEKLDSIKKSITNLETLISSCSQLGNDAREAAGTLKESDTAIRDYLSNYDKSMKQLDNILIELNSIKSEAERRISQH